MRKGYFTFRNYRIDWLKQVRMGILFRAEWGGGWWGEWGTAAEGT